MTLEKTYLDSVIKKMTAYKDLGEKTFEQLEESDFHFSPNEESNSIAIIVQHISGNMLSRWTNFLAEDGEKEWRQRDDEFEVHQFSKQQIIDVWEKGWQCLFTCLQSLNDEDLMKTITIRKEAMPVIDAINRQLAHYPYHIGQIIYIGKILKNQEWKNLSVPKKKVKSN
ncbi:MAG TPA: DUF1572 family protein [Puia sp.]|nr:DUF1572 family protein [Puia sp.]